MRESCIERKNSTASSSQPRRLTRASPTLRLKSLRVKVALLLDYFAAQLASRDAKLDKMYKNIETIDKSVVKKFEMLSKATKSVSESLERQSSEITKHVCKGIFDKFSKKLEQRFSDFDRLSKSELSQLQSERVQKLSSITSESSVTLQSTQKE